MLNTNSDLAGNINMAADSVGINMPNLPNPMTAMGVAPPQQPKKGGVPPEFRNLNTLDEPVCDTIVRSKMRTSNGIENSERACSSQ